jgi:hypothetical protein
MVYPFVHVTRACGNTSHKILVKGLDRAGDSTLPKKRKEMRPQLRFTLSQSDKPLAKSIV